MLDRGPFRLEQKKQGSKSSASGDTRKLLFIKETSIDRGEDIIRRRGSNLIKIIRLLAPSILARKHRVFPYRTFAPDEPRKPYPPFQTDAHVLPLRFNHCYFLQTRKQCIKYKHITGAYIRHSNKTQEMYSSRTRQ